MIARSGRRTRTESTKSVRPARMVSGERENGTNGRIAVSTTAWSVFVHSSPMYVTSKMPRGRRAGRPASRPSSRFHRQLPFRPDGYPYANRRWSERLGMKKVENNGLGAA